jgi:hypothetical protein
VRASVVEVEDDDERGEWRGWEADINYPKFNTGAVSARSSLFPPSWAWRPTLSAENGGRLGALCSGLGQGRAPGVRRGLDGHQVGWVWCRIDDQIPVSHLQNSMEIAGSVRARLQSCQKTTKKILGFSPCVYLFSFVRDYAAAKAGKSE